MDSGNVVPIGRHFCPACGQPMRLVLVIPRFGSFPELQTYECKGCGVSYTEAAKDQAAKDQAAKGEAAKGEAAENDADANSAESD